MTDTITSVEIRDGFFVATVQSERSAETLVEVRGNYPVTDALQPATTETYWLIVDGNRVLRQDDRLNLSDLQSRVLAEFVFFKRFRMGSKLSPSRRKLCPQDKKSLSSW